MNGNHFHIRMETDTSGINLGLGRLASRQLPGEHFDKISKFRQVVLTYANTDDHITHDHITRNAKAILKDFMQPSDVVELVLQMLNKNEFGYYLVDHAGECIFWLDDFVVNTRLSKVPGPQNVNHIGMRKGSLTVQSLMAIFHQPKNG